MSKSAAFKAACLGASLATAWSAAKTQAATDFQVSAEISNSTVSLSHLTIIVGDLSIAVPDDSSGISALTSTNGLAWAGTIQLAAPDNLSSKPWELIGLGTGPFSSDVVVAFSNPTSATGQSFENVFGTPEGTVADFINRRQSADVSKFFLSALSGGLPVSQSLGSSSEMMMFSGGTDVGTVTVSVTAIPEPSGLGLAAMGIAGLFGRIWRRR